MTAVAKLFQELSSNEQLHQKVLNFNYFNEAKVDAVSVLLKSVYIFMKGLQHECEDTKRTLSHSIKRLSSIGSVLCQECSEKSLQILYHEAEKENFSKTDHSATLSHLLVSDLRHGLESSLPCSKLILSPKKRRINSEEPISPQKKNKDIIQSRVEPSLKRAFPCGANESGIDISGCNEILAQETQEVVTIQNERMPIEGRTSIPETMPIDDCKSAEFTAGDESCDIFSDSSENESGNSEVCTVLHTSPIIGKSSSNRNSPLLSNISKPSNSFKAAAREKFGGTTTFLEKKLVNNTENIKTEPSEVSKTATFCKDNSPAMSPKCDGGIENSPSLLQLRPFKKTGASSGLSYINKPPSLVDICSSTDSSQSTTQASSNELRSTKRNENFLTSNPSRNKIVLSENTKKSDSEFISCKNSTSPVGNRVKRNLATEYFSKNAGVKRSSMENETSLSTHEHLSDASEFQTVSPQHSSVQVTNNTEANKTKGCSVVEIADRSGKTVSQSPSKILPDDSRMDDTKPNLKIQNGSLVSRPTARLPFAKRSATDVGSSSTIFRGSFIKWDLEPKSVQAVVKKNVKQTKLSKESFIVSKVRGNLGDDDPLLEEAKARSLATKAIDDRKRLQLEHPALRQIPSIGSQMSSTSPDHDSPPPRPGLQGRSDEPERKKCKSELGSSHSATEIPELVGSLTSSSILTTTQALKFLQDSHTKTDTPDENEIVKSPFKNSPLTKPGVSKESGCGKVATPKKLANRNSSKSNFSFRKLPSATDSPSKNLRSLRKKIADKPFKKSNESPTKYQPLVPSTSSETRKANMPAQDRKFTKIMDDSFDRVPKLEDSPQFAHAGAVERKKSRRLQLPGWSCRLCKEYYEGRQLSREELLEYMNRCSKHRSKHKPIINTPENFWKPDMSGSDEDD